MPQNAVDNLHKESRIVLESVGYDIGIMAMVKKLQKKQQLRS